eukprot:2753043-Prymnesium_polylepis.2
MSIRAVAPSMSARATAPKTGRSPCSSRVGPFARSEFRQHSATKEALKSVNWIRLLDHFVEKFRGGM